MTGYFFRTTLGLFPCIFITSTFPQCFKAQPNTIKHLLAVKFVFLSFSAEVKSACLATSNQTVPKNFLLKVHRYRCVTGKTDRKFDEKPRTKYHRTDKDGMETSDNRPFSSLQMQLLLDHGASGKWCISSGHTIASFSIAEQYT